MGIVGPDVGKGAVGRNLGGEKADGNGSKPSIVPHISSMPRTFSCLLLNISVILLISKETVIK